MSRKMNDFNNVRIDDGKIYGLTLSYYFNVRMSETDNPAICPRVNCDGMPVEMLCKKAWDAMKVSGRPSMKKLTPNELEENYNGKEINWNIMISQEAASNWLNASSMSDDQLDKEIERLMALKSKEDK